MTDCIMCGKPAVFLRPWTSGDLEGKEPVCPRCNYRLDYEPGYFAEYLDAVAKKVLG